MKTAVIQFPGSNCDADALHAARLLLDQVDPGAILCVTYTKAAAAEMQARLFDQLGGWAVLDDAALSRELARLDDGDPRRAR